MAAPASRRGTTTSSISKVSLSSDAHHADFMSRSALLLNQTTFAFYLRLHCRCIRRTKCRAQDMYIAANTPASLLCAVQQATAQQAARLGGPRRPHGAVGGAAGRRRGRRAEAGGTAAAAQGARARRRRRAAEDNVRVLCVLPVMHPAADTLCAHSAEWLCAIQGLPATHPHGCGS